MIYTKLASAIRNDVLSGLRGYHQNPSMNLEQLEDDIVDERLLIVEEYALKGLTPYKDLLMSINCIDVDCKNIENCGKCKQYGQTPVAHFEIPQIINDINGIEYIGSVDKQMPFTVYTSWNSLSYLNYRKRGKNKPYVVVDTTPNEHNMYDCWIFKAPMIKKVSVIAAFKDPRQLEKYGCCDDSKFQTQENMSFINSEIKRRLTEKKLRYYRSAAAPVIPNNQTYQP